MWCGGGSSSEGGMEGEEGVGVSSGKGVILFYF